MRFPYLQLTREEQLSVARMAVANYNNADNRMQKEFDEDPEKWIRITPNGNPQHSAFEGDYARDTVDTVLGREYGTRKAYKNGWGVGRVVRDRIVRDAIAIRKEYVALNICRERATLVVPAKAG